MCFSLHHWNRLSKHHQQQKESGRDLCLIDHWRWQSQCLVGQRCLHGEEGTRRMARCPNVVGQQLQEHAQEGHWDERLGSRNRGISSPSGILHSNPFSLVYQHWCFCESNTGDVGTEQAARDKLGGQKPGWTTMHRCPHRRGRPSCQCERCLARDPSPAGVYCIREVRATDRRIIKSRFSTWTCTAWPRSLWGGRAVAATGSWKHCGFFRPEPSTRPLLSAPSCFSPEVSRQVHWGRAALPQSPWRQRGHFGAQTSKYAHLSEQSC